MSLSCGCPDGDYEYWFSPPCDFEKLKTSRRQRCYSCKQLIDVGDDVGVFGSWRSPRSDIEDRIHGDEVHMANKYMCEECAGLYFTFEDLGFCITLGGNMRDLIKDYQDIQHWNRREKEVVK